MIRLMMMLFFLCFCIAPSTYAYEPDFELRGNFFISVQDVKSNRIGLQSWNINLLKAKFIGQSGEKEEIVDFTLIVTKLLPAPIYFGKKDTDNYLFKGIQIYEYDPSLGIAFNSLVFANNSFHFKFGPLRIMNIKIDFDDDGKLAGIAGSIVNPTNPEDLKILRLVCPSGKPACSLKNFNVF